MSNPNHLDFNALIPKFERRTCDLGDQTFDITDVPMGVGVAFTRSNIDPLYTRVDALIDATLCMLNQKRDSKEWVDRDWLNQHIPGTAFGTVTDQILAPFWNPPKKEGPETQPQKKL